jgi:hypothetical protein
VTGGLRVIDLVREKIRRLGTCARAITGIVIVALTRNADLLEERLPRPT